MSLKIGVVNVVSNDLLEAVGYLALQRQSLRKALGPDVEIVVESGANGGLETWSEVLTNSFFSLLDGKIILEKLHQLQESGCDGIMISCTQDPLLNEARAIVAKYGLLSRMAPMVEASPRLEALMMDAFKEPEIAREELVKGCREVIELGAHSVILGGTSLSNIAAACGLSSVPEYGAPIFDPVCVGARMLRYRIEVQRSLGIAPTSQAGVFRSFPAQFERPVMKSLGFSC